MWSPCAWKFRHPGTRSRHRHIQWQSSANSWCQQGNSLIMSMRRLATWIQHVHRKTMLQNLKVTLTVLIWASGFNLHTLFFVADRTKQKLHLLLINFKQLLTRVHRCLLQNVRVRAEVTFADLRADKTQNAVCRLTERQRSRGSGFLSRHNICWLAEPTPDGQQIDIDNIYC